MDILHCFSCFNNDKTATEYFMTACGHVMCKSCLLKAGFQFCKVCNKQTNAIRLMPETKVNGNYHMYASDSYAEALCKQLVHIQQFQCKMRSRLLEELRRKLQKYKDCYAGLQKQNLNLISELAEMKSIDAARTVANKKLSDENKQLKSQIQELQQLQSSRKQDSGGTYGRNGQTSLSKKTPHNRVDAGMDTPKRMSVCVLDQMLPDQSPGPMRVPPFPNKVTPVSNPHFTMNSLRNSGNSINFTPFPALNNHFSLNRRY